MNSNTNAQSPQPDTCQACEQVQGDKRKALLAVPLTVTNPKWLKRFQDKALDMLMQNDFAIATFYPNDEATHVGEPWFRGDAGLMDEEIIEEACKAADWMRFKRSKLVMGEPTAIVNAFAGHVHVPSRYEDVPGAVKVERTTQNPEANLLIAHIRAGMPDMCDMHTRYAELLAENARLKRADVVASTKQYVKLSQAMAKRMDQSLEGTVRIVTFDGGKAPLQGEVYKPSLKPFEIKPSEAHMVSSAHAAQESRNWAEAQRACDAAARDRFDAAKLKAKASSKAPSREELDAHWAKLGVHAPTCTCGCKVKSTGVPSAANWNYAKL